MTAADRAAANDRLAEARRQADRDYNDALTALDRVVVDTGGRDVLGRDDFARIASALLVFLQQITAFVDSKDRELAAAVGDRIDQTAQALRDVAELRTQMNVVQRSVQTLSRSAADRGPDSPAALPATAAAGQAAAPQASASNAHQYVAFEDEFRGSDAAIAEKVRAYVPIFAGASGTVVDLGCGRGELLAALKAAAVDARGVDLNAEMAAIARERGLDASHGDALAFLEAAGDDTLGGVVATQVIEHLEPAYLMRLLDAASRKLRAGAPIVLETINPACWLAFFSSYIRDLTHVRPIHPETLQYLLRANHFQRVELRYSAPVPEHMKMTTVDLPAAIVGSADPVASALASIAHAINANAVILNNLMFTHLDYAAIGFRA